MSRSRVVFLAIFWVVVFAFCIGVALSKGDSVGTGAMVALIICIPGTLFVVAREWLMGWLDRRSARSRTPR